MDIDTIFVILNLGVLMPLGLLLGVLGSLRDVFQKGRIITEPMKKVATRKAAQAIQRGDQRAFARWFMVAVGIRGFQVMFLLLVCFQVVAISLLVTKMPQAVYTATYWIPFNLLYLDDLLTGEDPDRWKRRFKALKNKVKWRWIPVPVPTTS